MLKRSKTIARSFAESAGIIAPTVADAQEAAENARKAMIEARKAHEDAEQRLQAAHERGASEVEITALEAAVAAAKAAKDRAEARYLGAESRLRAANEAEDSKRRAEALAARDRYLAAYIVTADEIDDLLARVAEKANAIDALRGPIAELARDRSIAAGVISCSIETLLDAAARKSGVVRSPFPDHPGAGDLARRDVGAIRATLEGGTRHGDGAGEAAA